MNTGSVISAEQASDEKRVPEPYFKWVSLNYPLLSAENLEQKYALSMLKLIAESQTEPVPDDADSRIVIHVDSNHQIYKQLKDKALAQFAQLCASTKEINEHGKQAREYLSYLVLSRGYPAYQEMQEELAEAGAIVLRELADAEPFRPDIYSTVSGVIAYSQNARAKMRLLMLDAFCQYFSQTDENRPGRRELSTVLYDALHLELKRAKADQSIEFQDKLIDLLAKHPHPSVKVLLTVLANEHSDELVKRHADESLKKLDASLMKLWEATTPDQVSSEEFRASSLSEIREIPDPERIQSIFNACKGLAITSLLDRRLIELNTLMNNPDNLICLGAAIAVSQIYQIELPCQTAGKAIEISTDWAINGTEGRYVLDALCAVSKFESLSEAGREKVANAFTAANLKFVLRAEKPPDNS